MSVLFVLKHALLPSFFNCKSKVFQSRHPNEQSGLQPVPRGAVGVATRALLSAASPHRALSCSWRWSLLVQVFVANPNKTQPILDILLKNQAKLIEFLSKFQNDRTEDEQFNDEKTYLVKQIRDLKRPAQQEAWFPINTENIKSKFSVCCSLFSIRHCYQFMRNITANLLLNERFSFYLFWFFLFVFLVQVGERSCCFLAH